MFNATQYDPDLVTLTDPNVDDAWKTCILQGYDGTADYDGSVGVRISAIFVIFVISTTCTIFPLFSSRNNDKFKIPLWCYLIARYFGTGVIVATAFIHLLDPAYSEIGGLSCVGGWGNWSTYSWCPAMILASVMSMFLIDIVSSVIAERKYGISASHGSEGDIVMKAVVQGEQDRSRVHADDDESLEHGHNNGEDFKKEANNSTQSLSDSSTLEVESSFRSQFAAFLVLEFGVIFHSIMIGLNLGSTDGDEFKTLYVVLVFHQSFEGLGIGARLSAIPWPKDKPILYAYLLCLAYGLVTPIAIAIGLGVRASYFSGGFSATLVTGILDAISAGILIYTGLIELLARDFLFERSKAGNDNSLTLLFTNIFCVFVGAGVMSLLGKWA